ncbi:glycoside hydrolase family 65 protein [Pseudactinotalea sp. Z1732]|uniref:glycoside hydrolase family 65 protein n=1 Tax=Pseudactinotalea sp. Z1732 TaxID=3413026 RepID=UPI003C7B6B09
MIQHTAPNPYEIDPWRVTYRGLDVDNLGQLESLFSLSNGHIGLRGSLDEGEPQHLPGTYINGVHEEIPLPYAERGYGYPEVGETLLNATDGKLIRLMLGDAPFDIRYGHLLNHERTLDMRAGTLNRNTTWVSPNGNTVKVNSQRLVSFTQRSVAAICYEVTALDEDLVVALQSDLLANEPGATASRDPRAGALLERPLTGVLAAARQARATLVHTTNRSELTLATAMDHIIEVPDESHETIEAAGDLARYSVTARLPAGSTLRLIKFLGYGWSHRRSAPALRDQVEAAVSVARLTGWKGLLAEQEEYLDEFWNRANVDIEGDTGLQQAVRFSMFHVLQAGARGEGQGIAAKGLTGLGYDGHTFWDAETFVLPMLTYTVPHAVRDHLRWRHTMLDQARERARELNLDGAAFAWRTITGRECSGYWPAGTAAFHINADIADATARYLAATQDVDFEAEFGVELLVETARLWASLGHFSEDGFHIDGITGPDEYTAVVNDNFFTNAMAQRNLREAASACERRMEVSALFGVTEQEREAWRRAADQMALPYSEDAGVHEQSEGFTDGDEWDFEGTKASQYPLMLHFPYFQLYRKQVIKQADLVLAMHLRGDLFTPEEKAKNFAYYEARTARDSSLSAATQAVMAAETGHLELAYTYWSEVAFVDLGDLHGNAQQGLHIASMGGAWQVAVAGFGGMRDHDGKLTFAPRLPEKLTRIRFQMTFAGRVIQLDTRRNGSSSPEETTYELLEGPAMRTWHHGEKVRLEAGRPVTLPVPPPPRVEPVRQPFGREPLHRRELNPRPEI